MAVTPEELTGAMVREYRERFKMSRNEFYPLCGFPSQTRLGNIETRESWKPGNREAVADAINRLLNDNGDAPTQLTLTTEQALPDGDAPTYAMSSDRPIDIPDTIKDAADFITFTVGEDELDDLEVLFSLESADDPITSTVLDVAAPLAPPEHVHVPREPMRLPPLPLGAYRMSNGKNQTWLRCRRKWWLAWFRRLAPRQENMFSPRAIGDRVHRALAMYYVPDGETPVDPRDALERVIVEDWTKLAAQARAAHPNEDEQVVLAPLAERWNAAVALDRAMVQGYVEWLAETGADQDYRVVASETPQAALIELPYDSLDLGDHHSGYGAVQAVALMDNRLIRITDNVRLFQDFKTVGDLTSNIPTLPGDPQMLHYHLVEWLNTPEGEARCDGALYTQLRRVKRTSRANPPFYDRVEVGHNESQLQAYKVRLLAAARDMIKVEEALKSGADPLSVVYPTWQKSCKDDCDFFAICPMFDDANSHAEAAVAALYQVVDPWDRYDRLEETDEAQSSQ